MGKLTKKEQGDRSRIHIHDVQEVKCWAHKLCVSREDLRKVVDKVGDSAAGVRKEPWSIPTVRFLGRGCVRNPSDKAWSRHFWCQCGAEMPFSCQGSERACAR
jgi:Protein of unknown function (DUF3606)